MNNKRFLSGLMVGLISGLVVLCITLMIVFFSLQGGQQNSGNRIAEQTAASAEKKASEEKKEQAKEQSADQKNGDNSGKTSSDAGSASQETKTNEVNEATDILKDKEARELFNSKVSAIADYIDMYYDGNPDLSEMYDNMLKAMVDSLGDIYSFYYTESDFEDEQISQRGTYCGIGAVVTQLKNTMEMFITQPYENSPAEKAGLLPMDQIIAVNSESVIGQRLDKVVKKYLRGPKGTSLYLTVLRDGVEKTVYIVRDEIKIIDIYSKMLDDEVGYIYISEFAGTTHKQFYDAVEDLTARGAKAFIFDLRDNGGGDVDTCLSMVDYLIPDGKLMVTLRDKYGNEQVAKATNSHTVDAPVALLVNGNSASSSEIFTGALMDNGYAKVFGTKTFGKGIVQYVLPLKLDNSAIQLTAARYYTPSGVCIHEVGIVPDVELELDEEYKTIAPQKRDEDNQRDAAYEYLKEELAKLSK